MNHPAARKEAAHKDGASLAHRFTAEETCAPLDPTPDEAALTRLRQLIVEVRERTLFLVHYYQPTWIKRLLVECDAEVVVSDSQALARAGHHSRKENLFCVTVPFMAGSSAILAKAEQNVLLADPDAGCSLEASAPEDLVAQMFERFARLKIDFGPICYTNVGADVKALTGEYGGIIHTSSSAMGAWQWAKARGVKPVFLPDQHLAENVAAEAGISRWALWDNQKVGGGLSDEELRAAEMVVWTGQCNVHVKADEGVIRDFSRQHPQGWLILHPEVPNRFSRAALEAAGKSRVGVGSTRFIRQILDQVAEAEGQVAVGIATESNFVTELKNEYAGRVDVHNILRNVCACVHMRTRPEGMRAALEVLAAGGLKGSRHLVSLDDDTKEAAKAALSRSLELNDQAFSLNWS